MRLARGVLESADQDLLRTRLLDQAGERDRHVADDVVVAARHQPVDLMV